jgi:hypothetical protein
MATDALVSCVLTHRVPGWLHAEYAMSRYGGHDGERRDLCEAEHHAAGTAPASRLTVLVRCELPHVQTAEVRNERRRRGTVRIGHVWITQPDASAPSLVAASGSPSGGNSKGGPPSRWVAPKSSRRSGPRGGPTASRAGASTAPRPSSSRSMDANLQRGGEVGQDASRAKVDEPTSPIRLYAPAAAVDRPRQPKLSQRAAGVVDDTVAVATGL